MQNVLHSRYYNIDDEKEGKELDPNIRPEKQVINPPIASEVKRVSQIKPRLGQGRAGIKQKIKLPMPTSLNRPIVQLKEKPISQQPQNLAQPKITLKVPVPENSRFHDKIIPIPDYVISQTKSGDDSSSRMGKRKNIQDISREIPMYPNPIYRPPPKPNEMSS